MNDSWIDYLLELRKRVLKSVVILLILFIIFFIFSKQLFYNLAIPLLNHLPVDGKIIATTLTAPFLVPIKLSFLLALFFTTPYLLYQIIAYVKPALYHREKSLIMPLFIGSLILFYSGILFAYFIILPLVFKFLINMAPNSVSIMTDMSHYLDFVSLLLFAFGIAFEVPILVVLLILTGITNRQSLKQKRAYVILLALVVGMLLTPPDVISQILLAVPIYILFELGLLLAYFLQKKSHKNHERQFNR